MAHADDKNAEGKVLSEKIKGIRVAMLTTLDTENNSLYSRPMVTQDIDFDGALWFFTQVHTLKVDEANNQPVNISYVSADENRYVSVSGVAELVRDQKKIEALWKPLHAIWFPGGKNDPELALLKVTVLSAEFWDGPSNKMTQIFKVATAFATGNPSMGANETLQFQ